MTNTCVQNKVEARREPEARGEYAHVPEASPESEMEVVTHIITNPFHKPNKAAFASQKSLTQICIKTITIIGTAGMMKLVKRILRMKFDRG